MAPKHEYSKHPHDDHGNFRIRDETLNKWVGDGNGRHIRTNERVADQFIKELEERTDNA